MKKQPQKKYVSHDEYTPTQILKLIVKTISFLGTLASVTLFFLTLCNGTNKQILICGLATATFFIIYNLFPIENY
jgi:hypothetical protein